MYTIKIEFMVGEEVLDILTNKKVKILGTSYANGKLFPYLTNHFHDVAYVINDISINYGVRLEEQLKKI